MIVEKKMTIVPMYLVQEGLLDLVLLVLALVFVAVDVVAVLLLVVVAVVADVVDAVLLFPLLSLLFACAMLLVAL
jgi:hypothetical protein